MASTWARVSVAMLPSGSPRMRSTASPCNLNLVVRASIARSRADLVDRIQHFNDVRAGAGGEAVDHVGDAFGVERVEGAVGDPLRYQPRSARAGTALARRRGFARKVWRIVGTQQRHHRGQLLGSAHFHVGVETGPQHRVEPVQRVTVASARASSTPAKASRALRSASAATSASFDGNQW